ncbi:MAG TPA: DUF692 domain-containing protein [Polyangiaceae bacterium]
MSKVALDGASGDAATPPVPVVGIGVGLRVPHYAHILRERPQVDFFEIISENFMVGGGKPIYHLEQVLESYPVIQHGVSLNIGGPEAIDRDYLTRLKALVRRVRPAWISDHFCWSGAGGAHLHDLLPLPYCDEAVERLVERARMVQDFLEVPFALENTSSYMTYTQSSMTEWQFVSEVVERADIGLMFDVNNVFVSAYNHGFDAHEFVRNVPHTRIVQIHLTGHTNLDTHIIDTHRGHVHDAVWALYRETLRQVRAPVPTLIEWDDEIPEFDVLLAEAELARQHQALALATATDGELPFGHQAARHGEGDAIAFRGWRQGGPRESAAKE